MKIKSSIIYLIVLIVINLGGSIKKDTIKSGVCIINNYYDSFMKINTNMARENEQDMIPLMSKRSDSNDLTMIKNNMNSNVEDESIIENSTGHHVKNRLADHETRKSATLTDCKRVIGHHLKCFRFEMLEIFIKKCLCYD